jgi:hypothetical protein
MAGTTCTFTGIILLYDSPDAVTLLINSSAVSLFRKV